MIPENSQLHQNERLPRKAVLLEKIIIGPPCRQRCWRKKGPERVCWHGGRPPPLEADPGSAQGHTCIWELMNGSFTTHCLFDGCEIPFLHFIIKLDSSGVLMCIYS